MNIDNNPSTQTAQTRSTTTYDAGLHRHMQNIYNRMAVGVLVTALTAWAVASTPALFSLFFGGPQIYVVIFAPLAIVWFGFNPMRMSSQKLMLSFLAISVLYGISFSAIAMVVAQETIARAFFVAAAMFAGLSIYGYTTKKNLDGMGAMMVMGIWGILIASVLNMFFQSSGMQNVIAGLGIIAFSGITAWQTQSMKEMYSPSSGEEANSRMAWSAALTLYISFIALFQYILHFMNNNR